MPHEVHTSERRSFRGCRRRWDLAYRQGFVPEEKPRALEFGIAFHIGMEHFYAPETWDTTTPEEKAHKAVTAFVEECEKQKQSYLKTMKIRELPEDVEADYEDRIRIGTGMFAYYGTHIHPKYDDWFKPVKVEVPFSVPIQDPDAPPGVRSDLRCTDSPNCGQSHSNDISDPDSRVVFAGRIDLLVEDLKYGGYYIWDHKTAAVLAANDDFLQLDDQIASYCWALLTELGIDVRGFIYQEIRKDYPRPPKELKRMFGGRMFSTAQTQSTIAEVFVPYVEHHDPIAYENGSYDEYIDYLNSSGAPKFHQRFVLRKDSTELDQVGKNISLESADMTTKGLRIYPSVGKFTCSSCAYRQPCIGMFRGEDVSFLLETTYNQTNRRYWMDQPRSSDKAGK